MTNWLQMAAVQLSSVQLHWVHEISQTALAAAVATLGLVIMLELRSISRLRRAVDTHLVKLFEQLNLLRSESQQLIEAQVRLRTPKGQSSIRKLRNCSLRLGWRSLRSALASIWRMRSRVTSNCLPTSSSV